MADLKNLGLKIATLYRRGHFEDGHTELGIFIDILMNAIQQNKLNKIINIIDNTDFFVYLEDVNDSFNRNDFIRIADILEYEISYKNCENLANFIQ